MNKRLISGAAVAALVLAGCGGSDSDSNASAEGGGSGGDAKSVAYISPVGSQPGQQQVDMGLQGGAKELGWSARVLDANLSADRQVSHVDTAISQNVDAFASWTLDPGATAGAYERAQGAGIPVIGVNSTGEGVSSTVWWEVNTCGPNNPHKRNADFIAERRPNAKVIVMGGPPVPSIAANVKCFSDAAKAAGLEVLAQTDNTKDAAGPASQLAADQLTKHPDVEAFWAYNDQSALGISAAVTQARKTISDGTEGSDGIMVFGVNGDPDASEAVREKRLTGSWDTDSVATGWTVVKAMQAAIDDPEGDLPDLTVQSVLWTPENISDYVEPGDRDYSLDSIPLVDDNGELIK